MGCGVGEDEVVCGTGRGKYIQGRGVHTKRGCGERWELVVVIRGVVEIGCVVGWIYTAAVVETAA
jgi:hypothetical protein